MKPRRRGHRRRSHIDEEVELNVTGFMNLMVVLIPFLLTSVVLTRFSVLSITLPAPSAQTGQSVPPPVGKVPYSLSIRLEQAGLRIHSGERDLPLIPRLADGTYDTAALSTMLLSISKEHPDHKSVRLMPRTDTPYQELVSVMDAVTPPGQIDPLFPDIQMEELQP